MLRTALVVLAILATPASATTECIGRNLIEALPAEIQRQIDRAVEAVPYHRGLLWRASKGEARMVLVGTYHFPDPGHDRMMARLAEPLSDAAALYVEAGPEEEARLQQALTRNPALMFDPDGPTLPERLEDEEWQRLSAAMESRGLPAIMVSRMRPWYVSLMLGISPCMLRDLGQPQAAGLDRQLTRKAGEMDLPVRALEDWDTVFRIFQSLTPEQEMDMIRASLPAAEYADDYAATLADVYFDGDVWRIWEFTRIDAYRNSGLSREAVDEQLALGQELLMDRRNQAWIAPLIQGAEEAARDGKGIVAGFGALHLPGEGGVLQLLAERGWQLERLDG